MNREDVIRMAREIGFEIKEIDVFVETKEFLIENYMPIVSLTCTGFELQRFAALVAEAEREACAVMVERGMGDWLLGKKVAAAIRAMGDA